LGNILEILLVEPIIDFSEADPSDELSGWK